MGGARGLPCAAQLCMPGKCASLAAHKDECTPGDTIALHQRARLGERVRGTLWCVGGHLRRGPAQNSVPTQHEQYERMTGGVKGRRVGHRRQPLTSGLLDVGGSCCRGSQLEPQAAVSGGCEMLCGGSGGVGERLCWALCLDVSTSWGRAALRELLPGGNDACMQLCSIMHSHRRLKQNDAPNAIATRVISRRAVHSARRVPPRGPCRPASSTRASIEQRYQRQCHGHMLWGMMGGFRRDGLQPLGAASHQATTEQRGRHSTPAALPLHTTNGLTPCPTAL
jgi:hypothetical protein